MKKIFKKLKHSLRILINSIYFYNDYVKAFFVYRKNKKSCKNIEKFCFFIGYPRSGHSVVGSILDAHKNIIISHELDVLKYIDQGLKKEMIYGSILRNSLMKSTRGREQTGYKFDIPNEWQGRFDELKIIGDKKGGTTSVRIQRKKSLVKVMGKYLDTKVVFIHVTRNPFDNISTIFSRSRNLNLEGSIETYFSRCEAVMTVKREFGKDVLDLKYEDLVEDPKRSIERLCKFLGVECYSNYIENCSNLLYKNLHKSRFDVKWNNKLINIVKKEIKKYPFLKNYTFE